ncbi:unnamed protein product [marine sediment metagenome]|uniref:Uncharacterized protein n=1 Tax=marine sediment metagenome TaxID=412755 RepID=X0YU28_9ZZZZ
MEYSNESYVNGSTINLTISRRIGNYNFTAIAIDPYKNKGNATFYFEVQNDSIAPNVTIVGIENNTLYIRAANNTITFNASCDDNFNETYTSKIYINDTLFFEDTAYENGTYFGNTSTIEDGSWNWTVICIDPYKT